MRNLHISVKNKVATYQQRDGNIVCGNSDYQIIFTFDSEWDAHEEKTARFIWNNKFVDVTFSGDTVPVPMMSKTNLLKVGVYAGELNTTTSAQIPCTFSVLCESATAGTPDRPNPGEITVDLSNYYTKAEIDALLENVQAGGKPIEVSTEEEMQAGEVGSIYTYTGESGTFENGVMYLVEEGE